MTVVRFCSPGRRRAEEGLMIFVMAVADMRKNATRIPCIFQGDTSREGRGGFGRTLEGTELSTVVRKSFLKRLVSLLKTRVGGRGIRNVKVPTARWMMVGVGALAPTLDNGRLILKEKTFLPAFPQTVARVTDGDDLTYQPLRKKKYVG